MHTYIIVGGILMIAAVGVVSLKQPGAIFAGLAQVWPHESTPVPAASVMPANDQEAAVREVNAAAVELAPAADRGNAAEPVRLDIDIRGAAKLIEENRSNADFVILDVRTPEEFEAGHIAGARNLDFYAADFRTALRGLDRSKTYFVYCRSGNRSGQAMQMMARDGFTTVYNLSGGVIQWDQAGLPLEN